MKSNTTSPSINRIRGLIAGSGAVAIQSAAETLFERGGQQVLGATARQSLRQAAEEGASRVLEQSVPALLSMAGPGSREVVKAASCLAVGTAAVEVLKGFAKAGVLGFAVDGAVATVEGVYGFQRGRLSAGQTCKHVVREAGTGAVAAGAGVVAAAGLVVLTGGTAAPVVFIVAASCSIVAKVGLKSIFN